MSYDYFNMPILGLFSKNKAHLYAVIDIGSHSIKTIVFEMPLGKGEVPKIIKKTVVKLPASFESSLLVVKLREILFAMVRDLERVPEKITIGIGPSLGSFNYVKWSIRPTGGERVISEKELNHYFQNLFEQHRDPSLALLAYPLEIFANGYSVSDKEKFPVLERALIKEIVFQTLAITFLPEAGTALADAKRSLGGLPIEFVPVIAAEKLAMVKLLNISDALLVDVGGEDTVVALIKEGQLVQISSFPLGGRHFLRGIAKIASISMEEMEDVKRQYVQGLTTNTSRNALHDFLVKESDLWKQMFLQELDIFYPQGPFPKNVLLYGDGAHLPEIAGILRSPDWIANFSYVDSPEIRIPTGAGIFGGDTLGGFVQGPEDLGLASLMVYSSHT